MDVPYQDVPKFIFSWIDYTVFAFLLGLSVSIGIYFGFFEKKQNSTDEYLLGGRTMKIIPIAVSLVASCISGITILGVPADIYRFGTNYLWINVSVLIACLITTYIYLPVFFKLQFTTIFEYLDVRFDRRIRIFASFLFTLTIFIYNPIVIYIPALAFSQATGISVHVITPIISLICIFYTTIGGLKAVVWTDTLQFVGIIGSSITIFFMGISAVGGVDFIFQKNLEGERLNMFNLDVDPTFRDGFWAYMIGGTAHWISLIATSQGTLQKLLSVPSLAHARSVMVMYCFGMILLITISTLTGNILYAKYFDCDPLSSKMISRLDQILPHFVMEIAGNVPGLPGIFIGGVFSAGLSSLSACLNTISGTVYQDFILPFMPANTTQKTASNILKLIVAVSGILSILLVFVVERMGGMLALVTSLQGVVGGPQIGLFTLGVLFPSANANGALWGGILGLIITGWIALSHQWYGLQGRLRDFSKPVSVEGCAFVMNITSSVKTSKTVFAEEPFVLYQVSFWYNTFIGAILVIVLGLIISWLTKDEKVTVHRDLLCPLLYSSSPSEEKSFNKMIFNKNIDFALNQKEKEEFIIQEDIIFK